MARASLRPSMDTDPSMMSMGSSSSGDARPATQRKTTAPRRRGSPMAAPRRAVEEAPARVATGGGRVADVSRAVRGVGRPPPTRETAPRRHGDNTRQSSPVGNPRSHRHNWIR